MDHDFIRISDLSSELSSPPSSLTMDLDFPESPPPPRTSPNAIVQPQGTPLLFGISTNSKSPFERLPYEMIEKIATILPRDSDVRNLALTSTYFAAAILPSWSGVWRDRFLSLYDHPIIDHPDQFRFAYQIRRLTTKAFVSFEHGVDEQGLECLETLKDMVMEAYHTPRLSRSNLDRSKNLNLFAQPAPFIDKFLAQPLCASQRRKYGTPHDYFDALQLCLSHVMLAPRSYAAIKSNSRENYDVQRVYKFDHKFHTIYYLCEKYQGLQSEQSPSSMMTLSLHDLLHIRNFWNRHLSSVDENTYLYMASKLDEIGRGPSGWKSPLKPVGYDLVLPTKWIGHYSCIHPFPKRTSDLQDSSQTCAEDWTTVEPLTLDIVTSRRVDWFPQIFANIPGCRRTLPDLARFSRESFPSTTGRDRIKFFRGVAPFITISPTGKDSSASANKKMKDKNINEILNETDLVPGLTLSDVSKPNIAPYPGLRVRGLAYSMNAQKLTNFSGNDSLNQLLDLFTRILFVLYKPTDLYLLATAENWKHVQDTKALLKHSVIESQPSFAGTTALTSIVDESGFDTHEGNSVQPNAFSVQNSATSTSKKAKKPKAPEESTPLPDRSLVISQEDAYHRNTEIPLQWDDIEYAYAYEGSILPGGEIQMGRWWRCDPWIAREGGLPIPTGLFGPVGENENDDVGSTEDNVQSLLQNFNPPTALQATPSETQTVLESLSEDLLQGTQILQQINGGMSGGSGAESGATHNSDGEDLNGGDNNDGNGSGNDAAVAWLPGAGVLEYVPNANAMANANHPLAAIWDEDAVPRGERGPFVFWADRKGEDR